MVFIIGLDAGVDEAVLGGEGRRRGPIEGGERGLYELAGFPSAAS